MGLDMYLEKRTYVKRWDHHKPEEQFELSVKRGGKPFPDIKPERVKSVVEEVMYWRKANQIHAWFIGRCGDGDDDQREIYVPKESLQVLLETCEKVIEASKLVKGKVYDGETYEDDEWKVNRIDGKVIENSSVAQELLPTQEGFFFGCTEYDQYYLNEVVRTRDMLKEELNALTAEGVWPQYYYRANW